MNAPADIGSVQTVVIAPKTGKQYGGADSRREGTVIGWPGRVMAILAMTATTGKKTERPSDGRSAAPPRSRSRFATARRR